MELPVVNDPFSSIAASYDADFSATPEVRALRDRIQKWMEREWSTGESVLDIGCGTGDDATFLARLGCAVTAIDASPLMVEQTKRKLSAAMLTADVRCMPAESLAHFPGGYFQGVLSDFGALCTLQDLTPVLRQCARILSPGGTAIFCLINRFSLWESVAFIMRGRVRQAARRWAHGPVMVNVGQGAVPVFYHSPWSVRRAARPWFHTASWIGLNVVAPLPSSRGFVRRHSFLAQQLLAADNLVGRLPLFRSLGDHVVIMLRKRRREVG